MTTVVKIPAYGQVKELKFVFICEKVSNTEFVRI